MSNNTNRAVYLSEIGSINPDDSLDTVSNDVFCGVWSTEENDMSDNTKQPPIVQCGTWGTETEWVRRLAAANMRLARRDDPAKFAEWVRRFGEERLRRDYPEAWADDNEFTKEQGQ